MGKHPLSLATQQAEQGSEQTAGSWCLYQLQTLSLPCPALGRLFASLQAGFCSSSSRGR